jgi:hypothetical protein
VARLVLNDASLSVGLAIVDGLPWLTIGFSNALFSFPWHPDATEHGAWCA